LQSNSKTPSCINDSGDKEPAYFQAVSNILSQQNGFLLQQAVYLMDQVPHLVTAVEYNTVALAHVQAGDPGREVLHARD
jgi:hypothetical protein